MVHFVKEYDYPQYVKSVRALGGVLRRKEYWNDFEENALGFFMKAESIIEKKLNEAATSKDYVAWCKSTEAMQLSVFATQLRNLSCNMKMDFYVAVCRCCEWLDYLTSEKCIHFYLDD